MVQYFHSVRVDLQRCEGCAACIEKCPMNAIHLHDGKAAIMEDKCIDCGECIRTCPHGATIAVTDTLQRLSEYTYRIALLAPSLQVLLDIERLADQISFEDIQSVFSTMGFNEVFEVGLAAQVVAFITGQYIRQEQDEKPLFSSSCPAVLRLLQMKFPGLLKHVARVLSPVEVAARMAKEAAEERTGLPRGEIGAFFISPCPAKVTEMKQPFLTTRSAVDGVIGTNLVYGTIVRRLSEETAKKERAGRGKPTGARISTPACMDAPESANNITKMGVSGIQNVICLLKEMKGGNPVYVDLVELQACTGGCLGGSFYMQDPFAQAVHLTDLIKKYRGKQHRYDDRYLLDIYNKGCFASTWQTPATSAPGPKGKECV